MLTVYDEFAGIGGFSEGLTRVRGTRLIFAANHDRQAIRSHQANFPECDYYDGDLLRADITTFPRADVFSAAPVCPPWSNAKGQRRDFDRSTQGGLFWEQNFQPDEKTRRARALMEEIPRYLQAMKRRGAPVLAGMVENVPQCALWDDLPRWTREVKDDLYDGRLIAINAMHTVAPASDQPPQDRDRFIYAYWLKAFGRAPNWNKWLRPRAYCPACDVTVDALQVFKTPGTRMGTYGRYGQYYYRCPNASCRNRIIEPPVRAASEILDLSLPITAIGDRAHEGRRSLSPATLARIHRGILRYPGAGRLLVPYYTNGRARPVSAPIGTIRTRDCWYLAEIDDAIRTDGTVDLNRVRYRGLKPHELQRGMAFPGTFQLLGDTEDDNVRLLGNAVPPAIGEVVMSALVETITGEQLDRFNLAA